MAASVTDRSFVDRADEQRYALAREFIDSCIAINERHGGAIPLTEGDRERLAHEAMRPFRDLPFGPRGDVTGGG